MYDDPLQAQPFAPARPAADPPEERAARDEEEQVEQEQAEIAPSAPTSPITCPLPSFQIHACAAPTATCRTRSTGRSRPYRDPGRGVAAGASRTGSPGWPQRDGKNPVRLLRELGDAGKSTPYGAFRGSCSSAAATKPLSIARAFAPATTPSSSPCAAPNAAAPSKPRTASGTRRSSRITAATATATASTERSAAADALDVLPRAAST